MVWLNLGLLAKSLKTAKPISKRMRGQFVDSLRLTCVGGHGGNGVPKYGGIGGQGGCVYFVATENTTLVNCMKKFPDKRISAGHGEDSSKQRLLGRRGVDRRIEVPTGVSVEHNGKVLSELNDLDATCIVAGGGGGGCSGNSFLGHKGETKTVRLDLKLIADVGLVGFPNAGKSTLLKTISNASPKIASYPFTTIRPQIGVVKYDDLRQISVADLPGLIEGAHANIGMGHKFLKHIERTRLLLMVVDVNGFKLSPAHAQRSCLDNVFALNKELELYDESLFDKPCVLLVNKLDTVSSADEINELLKKLRHLKDFTANCPEELRSTKLLDFERIIAISAQEQQHIGQVKRAIREVLDERAELELSKGEDSSNIVDQDYFEKKSRIHKKRPPVNEQFKIKLS